MVGGLAIGLVFFVNRQPSKCESATAVSHDKVEQDISIEGQQQQLSLQAVMRIVERASAFEGSAGWTHLWALMASGKSLRCWWSISHVLAAAAMTWSFCRHVLCKGHRPGIDGRGSRRKRLAGSCRRDLSVNQAYCG